METPVRADLWSVLIRDADGRRLLAAASALPDPARPTPAEVARFRAQHVPELVGAALECAAARRRGRDRFEQADELLMDRTGSEQASGTAVARAKVERFVAAGVEEVADLCCGIGGDLREFVHAGLRAEGVDLDPVRVVMAGHNAPGARVVRADVLDRRADGRAFHLDPARRDDSGRRLWRLADLVPGPDWMGRFVTSGDPGAVKLGPGLDPDELPWRQGVEIEWLGDAGGLRQAVLWCGALASDAPRSACRADLGLRFAGVPCLATPTEDAAPRGYLFEPDPALERAGLAGARLVDALELAPGLGLFTADAPLDDPWFARFAVREVLPFRDRTVREWLFAHDAGVVEVKTRGRTADALALQRGWRGRGDTPYTVFVLRCGGRKVSAIVTERVVAQASSP